jgi:hypothetical protein
MYNEKMKVENRNAIIFLDNVSCHLKATLSDVNIAWFQANATRVLQPMDMGVIYTFKSHYKRFLMQSLILNVEADSSYALGRSVSVLDAVNWIGLAVKKIKAETVKKIVLLKLDLGEVMWQIIWRRRVETLLQYLISAEEMNFPVIQRALFGVMTI